MSTPKNAVVFYPPNDKDVHLALLSGHSCVVKAEGSPVEARFRRAAIQAGCLTKEMKSAYAQVNEGTDGDNEIVRRQKYIKEQINVLLNRMEEGDFDGDGKPSTEALTKLCQFHVGAGERDKAWREMEAGDGVGAPSGETGEEEEGELNITDSGDGSEGDKVE